MLLAGQPVYAAEGKLAASGVVLSNDTQGEVPGNPKAEIAKFQQLARVLSAYSKIHDGAYPPSGADLLKDILGNMSAYGFHNFQQVTSLFFNPDSKSADNPSARADPKAFQAFTLHNKALYVPSRPNEYSIAFPGEAGVPKTALTYQQLYPQVK